MRCVFFGSPEFALGSLEALLASKHQVVGFVTQPDRPAGRGLQPVACAVKRRAAVTGLPILQPEKVNSEVTYGFLSGLNPDILVVVAYGEFLGLRLLEFCGRPPVNVHPSLLPDLRGAAPVQWALLRGYRRTGITTQLMALEMDAGDILLQEEFPVSETDSAKDLLDRFSVEGGRLLVKTLDGLAAGTITPRPQNHAQVTFAPMLAKEKGLVKFADSDAWTTHNQVRGLYPWPGAYAFLGQKRVKILRTAMARGQTHLGAPGAFWFQGDRMFVACRDGVLEILELQPEGKRPLKPKEFENGIKGAGIARFDGVTA
ncbi:MAG: methionyl-tRNA formyltransferase [Bdellovibrionota bacterium]